MALSNSAKVELKHNRIVTPDLPASFDGFTILQISDLHVELSEAAMGRVAGAPLPAPQRADLRRAHGNHDTICMVPALEEMGIRMLLNERERIERGGASIHLAGIDDAHYYRMDNIEKAAEGIPHREFSILLSHTPEIYRQAAHADFNVLLSGHTHGGQICLPGGIPITLNCVLPRSMGNGSFNHHGMIGYTSAGAGVSIVPARFNCPPEVTLHHLHRPS